MRSFDAYTHMRPYMFYIYYIIKWWGINFIAPASYSNSGFLVIERGMFWFWMKNIEIKWNISTWWDYFVRFTKSLTLHCGMISPVGHVLAFIFVPKWCLRMCFARALWDKLSLSPSTYFAFYLSLSPLPVSPVFLVGRCGSLALPTRWRSGAVSARRSVCGREGALLGASRRNASFSDHLPEVPAAATGRDGDQHRSRCAWQCKIYDLNSVRVPFSASASPFSR